MVWLYGSGGYCRIEIKTVGGATKQLGPWVTHQEFGEGKATAAPDVVVGGVEQACARAWVFRWLAEAQSRQDLETGLCGAARSRYPVLWRSVVLPSNQRVLGTILSTAPPDRPPRRQRVGLQLLFARWDGRHLEPISLSW